MLTPLEQLLLSYTDRVRFGTRLNPARSAWEDAPETPRGIDFKSLRTLEDRDLGGEDHVQAALPQYSILVACQR